MPLRELDRKASAALLSVASNALLVAMKLTVGLFTGSVGVISEAIHSGIDLLASAMAFWAVRVAAKPADDDHAYGHGKVENLSGAVEAALIFVAAGMIAYEAIHRLIHPGAAPEVGLGLAAMAISCVVNFFLSRYLFCVARETDSAALEADAHHLSTDVYTGLGIFGGLALVRITGLDVFDALTALAVAGLIARIAWDLARRATGALLDISLPADEVAVIALTIRKFMPPLLDYHDLRTRKSGAMRHVDVHLTVPGEMTVLAAHDLADAVERDIRQHLGHCDVMTHIDVGVIDRATGLLIRTD